MQEKIRISKELLWIFGCFTFLILSVNIFSNSYGLTDTGDYLGVAKSLSGNLVSKMRSNHSFVYGLFLAQFLKLYTSGALLKLLNVVWILASTLLLYISSRKKWTLLLFIFSPVVWFMSVTVSPILPCSFLLFLGYLTFKHFEQTKSYPYLFLSGSLFGLTCILWDTMLFITSIFIICFFLNKKVKDFVYFMIGFGLLFSIRFIVDYALFNLPFFSLLRMFGGNASAFLKIGNYSNLSYLITDYILLFIVVTPLFLLLLYRFIKEKRSTHLEEIGFICLVMFLLIKNPQARYLLVVTPLFIYLLAPQLKLKFEKIVSLLLSLILIIFFVQAYFGATYSQQIEQDMNLIASEFPNQTFLAGSQTATDLYLDLSMYYWGNSVHEIVSWQDYDLWRKNESNFQVFHIESSPKVNEIRKLWIEVGLARTDNRSYEHIPYHIDLKKNNEIEGYTRIKEYGLLSVAKKN